VNGLFGRTSAETISRPFNVNSSLDEWLVEREVGLAAADYDQRTYVIECHLALRKDIAN